MRKFLKMPALVPVLMLALIAGLAACDNSTGGGGAGEEIWRPEPNGTLTVINNVSKDMVIFHGQTPQASTILGGIRALSSKTFDISDDVEDFETGGYIILRGMTINEYEANKNNLSMAKIDYSAMATYGQGKKFRVEISPNYTGDYTYKVTNLGKIGIELRKGSVDGEKIGYLPSLASGFSFYADRADGFAAFPVFIYYQRSTGTITTLKPTSHFESVTVSPRPATGGSIQAYTFPSDPASTWENIKNSLTTAEAYITVTNNVSNQSGRVSIAGTRFLQSQNGYDTVGSGETLTYGIENAAGGSAQNIVLTFYSQSLLLPVKDSGGNIPVLRNGYDYNITVSGSGTAPSGYTVTFSESTSPRDLSGDILSL
jgi:hypothetical protein